MTSLCKNLRWKGFYGVDCFTPEALLDHYQRSEVPWSCRCTAEPWGPDDDIADPERCQADRGCFVRSEKLIDLKV